MNRSYHLEVLDKHHHFTWAAITKESSLAHELIIQFSGILINSVIEIGDTLDQETRPSANGR